MTLRQREGIQMNRLAYAVLIVAAAACGDKAAQITIETTHPPALVAFRNESSAQWQSLATMGTSTFKVTATGPYRVVVACSSPTVGTTIGEIARTPDDDPVVRYSCQDNQLRVTGQMQQLGSLAIGATTAINASTNAPWTFDLPVSAGSFDIVMLFRDPAGAPRIAIRRDVAISGDTDLGVIDATSENAQAMVPTSFTASGLDSGEVRSVFVTLYTSSTTAILSLIGAGNTWDAALVPDANLRSTDRQNAVLSAGLVAGSQRRFRSVSRDVRVGDVPSLALPAPLGLVQFDMTADRLAATLPAGTDYDQLVLVRQGQLVGRQGLFAHTAVFSRSFIDDTGGTSAVLELDGVPGYQSEWRLDPAFPQTRQVAVTRGTSTADLTTSGMSQSNVMVQGFRAHDAALRDDAAGLAAAHEPTVVIADDVAVFAPQ
jgi:hypothetical protein